MRETVAASNSEPPPSESFNLLNGLTIEEISNKIQKDNLTQIAIPSYFTVIIDSVFSVAVHFLKSSSVTSIEGSASFCDCSLTQMIIPSSVTSIRHYTY